MKKLLPEPSEYMDTLLEDIKFNLTKDMTNVSRELVKNILGFNVGTFGDIKISQEKINLVKSRISRDLIQKIESDLVIKVEENLESAITKKYINQLTSDILNRVYENVENKIQEIIYERVSDMVTEKVNETLNTWLVASKFVDSAKSQE